MKTLKSIMFALYMGARYVLYIILLWLRVPLKLILNGLSAICFLCFLFAWAVMPDTQQGTVWGLGLISLGAFVISVVYDFVLMAVAPTQTAVIF